MSADWKQRPEGGGRLALRLLLAIARGAGRPLARLLLHPITLYFLLRRGPERRASIAFLGRALGRPANLLDGGEARFDIAVDGLEALAEKIDQGRGALLFGSHLGSFEAMRALARRRPGLKLRVVLDRAHSQALTQLLDALAPEIAAGVIDAGQDGPALMLQIQQAAAEGALVALLVDRSLPGQATVRVPFFGAPAAFALAPWRLAAVLKLPVVLGFGLYLGGNRYRLVFEPFSDGIDLPRARRDAAIESLIARYAARLEHHARLAPYNWFNFYDFWHVDDEHAPRSAPAPGAPAPLAARLPAGDGGAGVGAGRPR